jgi:hypothetical protein
MEAPIVEIVVSETSEQVRERQCLSEVLDLRLAANYGGLGDVLVI